MSDFDKTTKTIIGAIFLPLLMAVNCLFMQEYLRRVDKDLCKPVVASEKLSFEFSDQVYETSGALFSEVIPCSSAEAQFFYRCLGFTTILCFGLAIILPCIFLIRQRQPEQPKLFG